MLLVRYQLEFAILAVAPELKRPRSDLVLWPDGQAPSIVILLQAVFGSKPLPHVLWKNHVQQQEVCFKRAIWLFEVQSHRTRCCVLDLAAFDIMVRSPKDAAVVLHQTIEDELPVLGRGRLAEHRKRLEGEESVSKRGAMGGP